MRRVFLLGVCLLLMLPVTARADRASAQGAKRHGDQLVKRGALKEATQAYRLSLREDPSYVEAHQALATHYLRQRDYKATEALLKGALRRLGGAGSLWYNYAYALRKLGKYPQAIRAYRTFAKLEPSSADPYYGMGLALRAEKRHVEAARAFRRYVAMERSSKRRGWVDKARRLAAELEGQPKNKARPEASPKASPKAHPKTKALAGAAPAKTEKEVEANTPERAAAVQHKRRGDALVKGRHYGQAVDAYRKAIGADFSYTLAYNELGHALFALGRHAEAVKVFRIALRDNPEYQLGWYNLGYALRRAGRLREAAAAYKRFAKLRPRDPDPHYGLGLTHRAMGAKALAVRSFSRYVTLETRDTHQKWVARAKETIIALGGSQPAVSAKASRASTHVPKAAPKRLSSTEVRRLARLEKKRKQQDARLVKQRQRRAAAEERKQARLAKQRQRKAAAEERKQARLAKQRQRKAAAEERKQARLERKRLQQESRPVYVAQAALVVAPARVSGPRVAAPPTGTKVAADRPASIPPPPRPMSKGTSTADKLRVQGDSLARIGKYQPALALYRKALGQAPSLTKSYHGIAYCAQRTGDYQLGIKRLRLGLRDNPNYHEGWLHLARLRDTAGDGRGAVGSYRKYLRAKPADTDARFELARVLRHAGLKNQSIAEYRGYLQRERRSARASRRAAAFAELKQMGAGVALAVAPSPRAVHPSLSAPMSAAAKRRLARERRAEDRRLAQLMRKRKREAARQARLLARKKVAEKRKQARLERKHQRRAAADKRKQARLDKQRQRRDAADKRKQARLERKRPAATGRATSVGRATSALVRASVTAPPKGTTPAADRPASIPPPRHPTSKGSSAADKLRVQGDSLARIGKCKPALVLYHQALAQDLFLTKSYHGLAYCAQHTAQYQQGIKALRLALRDNPDYQEGWLHLARLRDTAGDSSGAVGSYRKYLRANPQDADARFELARVLRHVGLKTQAVAEYHRYLQQEKRSKRASRRAAAFAELKQLGVAVAMTSAPLVATKSQDVKPMSAAEKRRLARERRAEDRRLAQSARKRKREEARQARLAARREASEKKRQARETRLVARKAAIKKRRQLRLVKLQQRKEAAEARRRARLERLQGIKNKRERRRREKLERRRAARERGREDRMLARVSRQRPRKAGPPSKTEALLQGMTKDLDRVAAAPPRVGSALRPASDAAQGLVDVADAQFGKQRYVVALGVYRHAARLDPASTEPLYKAGVCAVALRQMHLAAQLFARVLQVDPASQLARTNLQMARAASSGSKPSESFRREAAQSARRAIDAGHYAQGE
ncbi:MAG: tetratricopeptide repeat protein, partial [Deltaproteobacteria bacterium]|nr:tetratricopeptide repeat protein [Deltaproteobacteria bacterium]